MLEEYDTPELVEYPPLTDITGASTDFRSDRNLKTGIAPVEGREVLERLAGMPISSWSYKAAAASIRHIGPVAQDFRTAFEVGQDDKTIHVVDASGVAMAAIQGLYQVLQEKDKHLAAQQQQIAALQERLAALEQHTSA